MQRASPGTRVRHGRAAQAGLGGPGRATAWLAVTLPAALALIVHRRALGLFFSPDDLVQFERVTGLAPQPPFLWRVLSLRLYEQALWPLLGP